MTDSTQLMQVVVKEEPEYYHVSDLDLYKLGVPVLLSTSRIHLTVCEPWLRLWMGNLCFS